MRGLTERQLEALEWDWKFWARPKQLRPAGRWHTWMLLGGRGMGKTRTGAETIRAWVEEAHEPLRIALVGQNSGDVRDVMIQGESGIINISPPWNRPAYIPGRRLLQWPNGSYALLFSGDTPNQLRGPQFHKAWVDELAKFQYPDETWDNLEFGLRLGNDPQAVVTTTPRPLPIIKAMLEDEMTVVTRGSSYENKANLPASFIERVLKKYEGTRVGRQEVHAEVLTDMPGALWTYGLIERQRAIHVPDMVRIVVAIDPAASSGEDSAESGIIVCGKDANSFGYVLRDYSGRYSPDGWAQKCIDAYYEFGADRVVGEVNNGGEMVETILRTKDRNVSYKAVHASRGKMRRAEPVAALYEQGKVWHHGQFAALEDQMATYNPDAIMTEAERRRQQALSPDRMDAMVWGITELMLSDRRGSLDPTGWKGVRR